MRSRGLLATLDTFGQPRTKQSEPGFRKMEGGTEQEPRQAEAMPGVNAARRLPDGALEPFIAYTRRAKGPFGEEAKDGVQP